MFLEGRQLQREAARRLRHHRVGGARARRLRVLDPGLGHPPTRGEGLPRGEGRVALDGGRRLAWNGRVVARDA